MLGYPRHFVTCKAQHECQGPCHEMCEVAVLVREWTVLEVLTAEEEQRVSPCVSCKRHSSGHS